MPRLMLRRVGSEAMEIKLSIKAIVTAAAIMRRHGRSHGVTSVLKHQTEETTRIARGNEGRADARAVGFG